MELAEYLANGMGRTPKRYIGSEPALWPAVIVGYMSMAAMTSAMAVSVLKRFAAVQAMKNGRK